MHFIKKTTLIFSVLILLTTCRLYAQSVQEIFQGSDWSQLKADNFTPEDLANFSAGLAQRGLDYKEAEQVALSHGMSKTEWAKLLLKLPKSPTGTDQNKAGSEPVAVGPQINRTTVSNSYQGYKQAPKTNIFGESFFNNPSLSFEPNLRIATPANYILGPDDELLITVSGYQEANIKTTVLPEGTIFIPQIGPINVTGLTIEQATARIRDKMGQTAYQSIKSGLSKVIISLGNIKSIHITAIGAAKPGNYVISSLATVFNSLYQCGGPGDINTYRDIELIRNNKVYQTIDIYQFLTKGDQKGNIPLQENDVINFPVYKKHVTISGEVKRPGIFELKDGETFKDLLFFAGGYTDKAYKATIKVKQFTDTRRQIKDISGADALAYEPKNGDQFTVDSVLEIVENAVEISGAVYRPGEFELTPGITVSQLIKRAGGLRENAFKDRATLTRRNDDGTSDNITFNVNDIMNGATPDIPLIKNDIITVAAINQFTGHYWVTISGEVKKPGTYPFRKNLSLKDMFFLARGFTDAASAYHVEVSRRVVGERLVNRTDSLAKVFDLNIEKGLEIKNDDFTLMPYDIITVRRNPGYTEQKTVTIKGEVNFPGSYTIQSKKERISDLLKRAGGLTPFAYAKGISLIRKSDTDSVQKSNHIRFVQKSIKDTSMNVIDDITRRNFKTPVNLQAILKKPGSADDYVLEDKDEIEVLKADPLVKVSGEVLSLTQTGFITGKNIKYYLAQAGGITDNARLSKLYVLYPNGSVSLTHSHIFGIFRKYPRVETGSEIIVPRKTAKKGLDAQQTIGILSAIVSLVSLVFLTISTAKN